MRGINQNSSATPGTEKTMKNLKLSPQLSNTRHSMSSTNAPGQAVVGLSNKQQQQMLMFDPSMKLIQPTVGTTIIPNTTTTPQQIPAGSGINNPHHHIHSHAGFPAQWKIQIQQPSTTAAHGGNPTQQIQHIQLNQYLMHQLQNHFKQSQNHLVCTCPPEVHKALLEQQLIQMSNNSSTTTHNTTNNNSTPKLFIASPQIAATGIDLIPPTTTQKTINTMCAHPHHAHIIQQHHQQQSAHYTKLPPPPYTSIHSTNSLNRSSSSSGTTPITTTTTATQPSTIPSTTIGHVNHDHLNLSSSFPANSLNQVISHTRQSSVPETIVEARAQISRMESQLNYLTSWIQAHAGSLHNFQSQVSTDSSSSGVPTKDLSSSLIISPPPDFHRFEDSFTRATSAEPTPSNSSLESAYSFKSNTSSDNNTTGDQNSQNKQQQQQQQFYIFRNSATGQHMLMSAPTSVSDSTDSTTPIHNNVSEFHNVPSEVNAKILQNTQKELIELKKELAHVKRLNQSMKVALKDHINEAFIKIKKLLTHHPALNVRPVRLERVRIDDLVSDHCTEVDEQIGALSDLEIAIEDLRMSVLDRRCRVNVDEVEVLALHLSRISKSLANCKSDVPSLEQSLTNIIQAERNLISSDENFLHNQPRRLETSLKLCKKLISTLFTLKRLGSVQDSADNESIPEIRTVKEVSTSAKRALLASIKSIEVNNELRMQKIEQAEKLRNCRKKMMVCHESLKFEKSLELAAKALREVTPTQSTSDSPREKSPKLQPPPPSSQQQHTTPTLPNHHIDCLTTQQQHTTSSSSIQPPPPLPLPTTNESDSMSSLTDSELEHNNNNNNNINNNKILPTLKEQTPPPPNINNNNHHHHQNNSNNHHHHHSNNNNNTTMNNTTNTNVTSSSSDASDSGSRSHNYDSNNQKRSRTILKTAGHNSSRSNRSSKVAFNRTVMVEDGSEFLQLNCVDEECCDTEYLLDTASMLLYTSPPPPPPRLSSQDETNNGTSSNSKLT